MILKPEKHAVYATYLDDLRILGKSFSYWEILHVFRMKNIKRNSLIYSVRKQLSLVVHMDIKLSI